MVAPGPKAKLYNYKTANFLSRNFGAQSGPSPIL